MAKILVVEDDLNLANNIKDSLEDEHFTVECVHDGTTALQLMQSYLFDLVVLDWQLPQLNGIEICARYRKNGGKAAILMLTGKTEIEEKKVGFQTGVDDYLTKPFDSRELIMRIRALLRRASSFAGDVLHFGNITLDTITCQVTIKDALISLRRKEYLLLEFFMRHPDQFFSSEKLIEHLWTSDANISSETVRVNIHRLRTILQKSASQPTIDNTPGMGYRLTIPIRQ